MHLHFERNGQTKCDCSILSLSWMGKVPDELPEEEGWKLNRNNYYQEGWLATGNVRGIVGVTFTSSHAGRSHEVPLRTNYNLRGHRSDVVLVKWNEPYQKLASCDSSGVIFVWIKYEGRWSIELINDRSTPVTHFSWSHDGRMALICYQDDFVLVGSVAGQRYWSSMLSMDALITSGCWTPDDSQVYLGTNSGQLVVMDVHGAMVSQVQLATECGITSMSWSCEKFKMEENEEVAETPVNHVLAVALQNGELVFMRGHDDVSPVRVKTGLRGEHLAMEWANSKELLAVAGTTLVEGEEDKIGNGPYENMVKFYNDAGALIYSVQIPCTQAYVTALTWGHGGRRLFVSLSGWLWCARVWRVVAPLQLLARVCAARALPAPAAAAKLPLPPALRHPLAALFAHTVRCMVPDRGAVRGFVSRPPSGSVRLHCTMLRHDEDDQASYTLYLEHMGGLVPLLKGKRTSKIRPEFVIFDPQAEGQGYATSGSLRESTSSSSGGSNGSGVSAGCGSPKAPGSPRLYTDSSDTERDEGCSGSPRRRPRRRLNGRRKQRATVANQESREELPYIDSLPEDVKLVEVTSNIWGTKFKMHGLAKNVPANLGQVTYKTSLLHLQPRQMTLQITELRDDQPVGPDPNFNPNIFSEDEEDVFQTNEKKSPLKQTNNIRRKLTLNERNNANLQNDNATNNNIANPSLARAESYDEFPFIDMTEPVNPVRTQPDRRVSSSTSCGNRHAISPLRCEGSVPTLQSPKNAVAPTDIIFERPSPQAVSCGGRGDFCSGRTEYTVRDNTAIKANIEQQSFNLNLTLEPSRHVTIKKCETHITENCLTKLRKNICSRGEPASYEMNTRIIKTFCNKNYENEIHPDAMTKRDGLKTLQRNDELKFIDEETPVETNISNLTDRNREFKIQRTTTVVPISPVCANVPIYNTMTRSCSVGYLDLVDPQVLHAQSSIAALNDQPRRLVLVNNKKKRQRKHYKEKQIDAKTPSLKKCGKSKSLDSSELPLSGDNKSAKRQSRLDLKCDFNKAENNFNKVKEVSEIETKARNSVAIEEEISIVPSVNVEVKKNAEVVNSDPINPADSDSDYSKYYRSLEQLAIRLLASRGGVGTRSSGLARECASAPASPRPARVPNIPAPSTPAPKPKQRHSSASPIRQFLNSPLLNRRRNKKPSESSDDENCNGYSEVTSRNYRDLETFQKAQLRNKLKRNNGIIPGMPTADAKRSGNSSERPQRQRQLVMHNKAPMWNENSQVYQLDFGGRVTQESAKNFQIEYHGKQVMQFGRIDGNAYTLDFQYPFSAIQAFAVALANVTQRLK